MSMIDETILDVLADTNHLLASIDKSMQSIADSLRTLVLPSCGHGTVGFCNSCFVLALQGRLLQ